MPEFHHQQLIVYRKAVAFVAVTAEIIPTIKPLYGFLRSQLGRAATSIPFNIAEGSAEFSKPEKARIYRIARRSAAECAAIFDVLEAMRFPDTGRISAGKDLLHEVIAMLTVMSRPVGKTPVRRRPDPPGT